MTIRIDGTNTTANPGITGADADTGLQFGTDEVKIVTGGTDAITVDASQRVGIGDISPDAPLTVTGGAIRSKNVTGDTGFDFYENGSAALVRQRNNRPLLLYTNNTVRVTIAADGLHTEPAIYNAQGAGSTVVVNSSGELLRTSSSAKYKTDIEDLQDAYADAVLNARPVWYRSTSKYDNPDWGWWGFIAEEIAEIDPRLVGWKTTEVINHEDGSTETVELETPVAEDVYYDRFVPHLLNLIKRQKEQIETLETQNAEQATTIASFEARISALEGGN